MLIAAAARPPAKTVDVSEVTEYSSRQAILPRAHVLAPSNPGYSGRLHFNEEWDGEIPPLEMYSAR
jgi:hypothetical protein